jgi:tetratricopeptide (TPR) repeat protein
MSPEPELYDLEADPGETVNVAASSYNQLTALDDHLLELDRLYTEGAQSNATIELDEEARARLASLGYIGTFAAEVEEGETLPNPRDKIDVYNELLRAKGLKLRGEYEEAAAVLEGILADDAGVIEAYITLGSLYSDLGRHEDAIPILENALGHKPGDLSLVLLLVSQNTKLARYDRALEVIADFEDLLPEDPRLYYTRGNLLRYTGETEAAIADYERSIAINPDAAAAWAALAATRVMAKRYDSAREAVDRALAIDPDVVDGNFVNGQLLQRDRDLRGAEAAYLRELEISPRHLRSAYNLSIVYRELGREPEEERYLRKAIEINPRFPLSYLYLARIYLRAGQNLEEAISITEWAVGQELDDPDLAFAYFLLADLYGRNGNDQRARENLRRAREIEQRLIRGG